MSEELTKPKPIRIRKTDWAEAVAIHKKSKTSTSIAHVIRLAVAEGMAKARKQFIN